MSRDPVVYLADASIWAWAEKDPCSELAERLSLRIEAGEVATCPVVVLELMHRARNGDEYEALREHLAPLQWIPLGPASAERAAEVQRELAHGTDGNHRRPPIDFLLAAAAEEAGSDVMLWFFDKDLRVICKHTGQPYEAEAKV